MSPRRTRSGKIISPESDDMPSSSGTGGKVPIRKCMPKRRLAIPTRTRSNRTTRESRNDEPVIAEESPSLEVNSGQNLLVEENNSDGVNIEDEPTTIEVGDDNEDTIEIVSVAANDSVIDLTDETTRVMSSPLRLGSSWQNSQLFLAHVPPNPRPLQRPIGPPVMVDLTDSPASKVNLSFDLTESPENHSGVSVQCPVCLESLGSIKRSGCDLVSTVCGHIFCSRCLPASLRSSGKCPTCRRRIGAKEFHKIFI